MEFAIFIITSIALCCAFLYIYRKSEKEHRNIQDSHIKKIEEQQKHLTLTHQELESSKAQIIEFTHKISELTNRLDEANKELKFYKNIEEDSGNLNVPIHSEEHESLLDQAAQQIIAEQTVHTDFSDIAQNQEGVLDHEQSFARNEMEHSRQNFFITGKAGTGKSFLLDIFRLTTQKSHIVLAPTGIAALNVNGATLHSTFGFDNLVNLDVDNISNATLRLKSEKRMILKEVSTIIIDEISMVRADTFDKIDRILKVINQNDRPFGGKQILLFGDLFQLPPVTKPQEYNYLLDRYGGIYFFCSAAYKKGDFRFLELTINHRQKEDEGYFSLLNRVRDGSVTPGDIATLNSRVTRDMSIYERFTTLLPTKDEVERLNKHHIEQLNSTGFTYQAEVVFNRRTNNTRKLESIFPILNSLYLKKGALVMMVANDPEHRWVNGTLGIVSQLSNERISVAIDKRIYDISPFDFTEQEITYANGQIIYEDVLKVKQYPIVPAYAITIHKSQGQTYQNIVCDIDRCFANGQAYVALSRCASLEGLHLKSEISGSSIHVDKSVLDFYRTNLNTSENESR